MGSSKLLDGFTDCELTLPHTGATVRCTVPTLAESAKLIRLFESTKIDDGKVADLMEQFPAVVGLEDPAVLDGLTAAEFLGVVTDFFSVRRDLATPAPSPAPPSPASASSSTGPS